MTKLTASPNQTGGFMKKTLLLVSSVAVLTIMAVFASAGSGVVMRGEIPFDFYVDNQLLPAGEYDFAMGVIGGETASNVAIRTKDGTVLAFLTTKPDSHGKATAGQVSFNHYSGKYFLSSVECPGYKADLRKSEHEKELRIQPETERIALVLPLK
jgi:hypothetical protein